MSESDVFICEACNQQGGILKDHHRPTHYLVRYIDKLPEESMRSPDKRLDAVEERLRTLTEQVERVEKLLQPQM